MSRFGRHDNRSGRAGARSRPPGIILFKEGREVPGARVIGFTAAERFARHLERHTAS